jgi:dTDP-4-dehydrorhamnose reductase
MPKPALLITGGSGYLGARLMQLAIESGVWDVHVTYSAHPINYAGAHQLDLRDAAATSALLAGINPAVVIHQAVSPRSTEDIAAIAPAARHVLDGVSTTSARLIFVSTDLVFDGTRPPYSDDSLTSPANPYAAAKVEAENLILRGLPDASLIVRPSLIYGFDPIDKQTGWLVNGIRNGQPVRLFTNEVRCPIWVDTLSLALLELAGRPLTGRLNLGGPPLNRWEFGLKMLECLGIQPGPSVTPALSTPEMHRPTNLTLDCRKARTALRTPILTIDDACRRHKDTA